MEKLNKKKNNWEKKFVQMKMELKGDITRITKITTTRSVKQFPVEPGDLYFDADGNPILNGFDEAISSPSPAGGGRASDFSRCSPSEDDYLPSSSAGTIIADDHSIGIDLINTSKKSCEREVSPKGLDEIDGKMKKETPSAPGIPQITECFEEIIEGEGDIVPLTISLCWSSPEFEGTAGPLIGYRVEFRLTNLDPEDHYQFRVVGANMAGFGIPSEACPAIRLRPETQYPPPPPSQPQIINIGTDNATIEWKNLTEGNYKYLVQYREINTLNWINAINSPIKENKFKVANLRPNGEYEFRIICLDENGKNSTSPSSGFIRIRPPAPIRNGKISSQNLKSKDLAAPEAPGKPKVLESGSNWIHLHWDTPIPSTSYDISSSPFDSNLAYLIEIREFGVGNSVWKQLFDRTTGQGIVNYTTINDHFVGKHMIYIRFTLRKLGCLTLCWQPAKSSLPVQGYEIEFRDPMQDASNWYRLTTDSLIKTCKTSIGSLLCGHQYQFRILARNSVGLSQPSDPSPLVTIGGGGGGNQGGSKETTKNNLIPLMEEMFVRESPPLPDRDDSPPPIYRQSESSLQWRDPTLKEVIDYLKSPDPNLVLDASGYLQHLTFNNDLIKEETRNYGGIECLINLLNSPNQEILRNSLAQLLKTCQNSLVHEEATGALWNISSADELKEPILNQTAEAVIRHAVYRIQEVVDNKYDPNKIKYSMMKEKENVINGQLSPRSNERSKSAPSGSPKLDITPNKKGGKFFSRRRKKSEIELSNSNNNENVATSISGPQLLWNPSTIRLYLKILEESANCEILEASAAAIQNLAGCPFYGSLLVRETVRIEKGLPILVELLRLREDRVGTERLRALAKSYPIYGRKTCKYATQVLYMMWQHKDLHELFKEFGLEESDFYSGTTTTSSLNKSRSTRNGETYKFIINTTNK
uniref:Fibronectin type-III domain-containing protein n=1 Tax=Meloidogyne javanica TaxID=6303 RepID=A0A915MZL6_MELJA